MLVVPSDQFLHLFYTFSTLITSHALFQLVKSPFNLELDSHHKTVCANLSKDLGAILNWGAKNCVHFHTTKTQSCSLSNKKSQSAHSIVMNDLVLKKRESFEIVYIPQPKSLDFSLELGTIFLPLICLPTPGSP